MNSQHPWWSKRRPAQQQWRVNTKWTVSILDGPNIPVQQWWRVNIKWTVSILDDLNIGLYNNSEEWTQSEVTILDGLNAPAQQWWKVNSQQRDSPVWCWSGQSCECRGHTPWRVEGQTGHSTRCPAQSYFWDRWRDVAPCWLQTGPWPAAWLTQSWWRFEAWRVCLPFAVLDLGVLPPLWTVRRTVPSEKWVWPVRGQDNVGHWC